MATNVSGYMAITQVSPTNNTDCRDMTEILLKVALNTITSLSFALFNIFTNCCMNLGDIKQQSKYKTNLKRV
jgi:hypothetical protein